MMVKPNARKSELEGLGFEPQCWLHYSAHEISINSYLSHLAKEIASIDVLDVYKSISLMCMWQRYLNQIK